MQKHILKFEVIISIILLGVLCFTSNFVYATSDSSEVTVGNSYANEIENNADLENNVLNDNEVSGNSVSNSVTETEEDIYSTGATNTATVTSTASTSSTKQISSYSTVTTLPEANLGLNNILNVILIAIGVIIILLAIAILVRLKG